MAVSQNGYKANTRSLIASYTIPGTGGIKVALRKGDASVVLLYVLSEFHKSVQPLRQSDTGGYAERVIRGGVSLSNHASGTAVDARWRDHPLGKRGTFTAKQVAAIRRILAFLGGVVRWGGDYTKRADGMHFEIVASPKRLAWAADKIRNRNKPAVKPPTPKKQATVKTLGTLKRGDSNSDVKALQRDLNRIFPAYAATPLIVDGDFGAKTEEAIKEFQNRAGLLIDGVVGPRTKAALRVYGIRVRG